jgi:hypothetical protein
VSAFTDAYVALLIKQYYDKPRASAEIAAQAARWEKVRDILVAFGDAFDVDTAVGKQLDIIGKVVGLPRYTLAAFDDDEEYRFFIKLKIANNNGSGYMLTGDRASIQDVVIFAFDGTAYVVDNKNMTLHLYIEPGYDPVRLQTILDLGLLPKPQGVRYSLVVEAEAGATFGFSNNPASKSFGAGVFARKVFL